MVKIYVIDNGGQWTHREYRVLRDLSVETKIIPNTTPKEQIDADALIFSGGALSMSLDDYKTSRLSEYLNLGKPVLGICFGMQFIAN